MWHQEVAVATCMLLMEAAADVSSKLRKKDFLFLIIGGDDIT
jgi:hypothetical protein